MDKGNQVQIELWADRRQDNGCGSPSVSQSISLSINQSVIQSVSQSVRQAIRYLHEWRGSVMGDATMSICTVLQARMQLD